MQPHLLRVGLSLQTEKLRKYLSSPEGQRTVFATDFDDRTLQRLNGFAAGAPHVKRSRRNYWRWKPLAVETPGRGNPWPWKPLAVETPGCGNPWPWKPLTVEAPGGGNPWPWKPLAVETPGSGNPWSWKPGRQIASYT
jgi:hypothetical protein